MDPTLTVLVYSSLAAAVSAVGVLPSLLRQPLSRVAIGWANALAAGFMLGTAYVLMAAGLELDVLVGAAGAALGIAFVSATHLWSGTADLDLDPADGAGPQHAYEVMLVNWLHSAPEGVAIGAAMALSVPLGIFVALTMALHNIPEVTTLAAALRGHRVRLGRAAALGVVTNTSQVLLAIFAFAIVAAAPATLPWALGFAVGSLVYLVMAELLPRSYQQAGHTAVAVVTVVAMGVVVLVGGGVPTGRPGPF